MNSDIVTSSIGDFDYKGVSIVDLKRWSREHAIHSDYVVGLAQPLHWCCLDLSNSIPILIL